jgi:trk system potassium uptake protein
VLWHMEQKDFLDSLFESVSALTTTGITAGITSMDMDLVSKAFLVVNMIAGRFEIIAIVYLFIEMLKRKK